MTGNEFLDAFPILETVLPIGVLALLIMVVIMSLQRKAPPETCPKKLDSNRVKAKLYLLVGIVSFLLLTLLFDWNGLGKALLQHIHDLLV